MLKVANSMTAAEYLELMGVGSNPAPLPPGAMPSSEPPKRASKWNNKPTWHDSPVVGLRRYDSKREASRANQLDLLVQGGRVVAWWAQHPIHCGFDNDNGSPCRMIVDFKILWADGSVTYEDAKGPKPTEDWRIKRNAVRDLHGIEVKTV